MPRIVSVDKSYGADGTRHYVTLQNEDGSQSRVEVNEAEAERFRASLQEGGPREPRLLTETIP